MKDKNQPQSPPAQSEENKTASNAISIPEITLPKGGGALKGIDEKFKVNSSNGTASFSLPFPTTPARNDMAPTIGLSYNSGAGNGPFGIGWSASIPMIKRKTDNQIPQYGHGECEDIFMFSESEDLQPWLNEDGGNWTPDITDTPDFLVQRFRPRIEGGFSRIEYITDKDTDQQYWKVTSRNNVTTFFGHSSSARIADPADATRIYAWFPEFSYDDKGNWIQYFYKSEDTENVSDSLHEQNRLNDLAAFANSYLKRIRYGNVVAHYPATPFAPELPAPSAEFRFELVLDYGEHHPETPTPAEETSWSSRPDAFSTHRAGFEIRTWRRCQRVLMFHHFSELGPEPCLVRSLDLDYETSATNSTGQAAVSYLSQGTQSGYIRRVDNSYSRKSIPPISFGYQPAEWNETVHTPDSESLHNAPEGLGNNYQWVDLNGEGISGILTEQGEGWYYKDNFGDPEGNQQVHFGPGRQVMQQPTPGSIAAGTLSLQDLDANGKKQFVLLADGLKGYFEQESDGSYQPFVDFPATPNVNLNDPQVRMLDLNGDGKPELVLTEDQVFVWYPGKGKAGYDTPRSAFKALDEERGPAIVFADRSRRESILLADMSGDGLTDLVRVRNGEICYWPNQGYGKFGAKVNMANPPLFDRPDQFDPQLIQVADVTGTGASDIIYLGQNRFRAYQNLSGNAWSDVREIAPFFPLHSHAKIAVVDLLGTGTSCLVWSSRLPGDASAPMRYLDLMDSQKPHVLTSVVNNMGKETRLEYKSSTWYYLKDKREGRPWATKLPFPVQVIHRVTIEDHISQLRFSTEYSYRHGYYDHAEREFRGFGIVDQYDTETYDSWSANNAHTQLEQSEELYQPPVLTRTWYHLGAFENRENILQQFANEYWDAAYQRQFPESPLSVTEPSLPDAQVVASPSLSDPGMVAQMDAREWREALRACKGMVLRQEVFALDEQPEDEASLIQEALPYSVATHNCLVQLIQPRAAQQYGVFMVTEQEALTIQYERNPSDPRISHSLNTRINEYGQILESVQIAYPRQTVDLNLPPSIQSVQARTLISASEILYTNDIQTTDTYRLRQVAREVSFELTGLSPSGNLFQIADFDDVLDAGTTEIDFHVAASGMVPQRRRLEEAHTHYFDDTMSASLPLGSLGVTGLQFEQFQLAYTPDLLTDVFGGRITNVVALMTEGGYVNRDGNWWIPSGQVEYFANPETINDARLRFFSPQAFRDPFGSMTTVSWHGTDFLLMESTTDPIGNQTAVETFDFRNLAPLRVRDINGNFTETLVDELGMVKATAVMGKGNEADDLIGLTAITEQAERDLIQQYFTQSDTAALRATAAQLLQHATTRFVYDFDRYLNTAELREDQLANNPGTLPCAVVQLLPAVTGSIIREQHHQVNPASPLQLSFAYSNGMGQVVMQKSQSAPGEALELNIQPDCSYTVSTVDTSLTNQLRWIGNGRTILNNKGNPVKQYEPYFSTNPFFEDARELVEHGVTPVIYYDAAGRNVRTELPDGTLIRVGFNAWQQQSFDANDTVLESQWYMDRGSPDPTGPMPNTEDGAAAWKAAQHANTPATVHFDTLGRQIYSLAHNRVNGLDEFYGTRMELDIEGNLRSVVDARDNTVLENRPDLLGQGIMKISPDKGEFRALPNISGKPLRNWNERGDVLRMAYDVLQRPTHVHATPVGQSEILTDLTIYGEFHLNATALNLRGQEHLRFDGAGLSTLDTCNFQGQVLSGSRRMAVEYRQTPDWSLVENTTDLALIDAAVNPFLESEVFQISTSFDALGRPTNQISPDGSITNPSYDEAGSLDQVAVNLQGNVTARDFVTGIDYNAKGQRERITYATEDSQNFSTNYQYDPVNLRLTRLQTLRLSDGTVLQDLNYVFDAVGNVTSIRDDSQQTVFFSNLEVEPESNFIYDSLYRLIRAEGREHAAQNNVQRDATSFQPVVGIPFPNSPEALQRYVRNYEYDPVGNITRMQHNGGNVLRWTRRYQYSAIENRLLGTSLPGDLEGQFSAAYSYDAHGNMASMPHLPFMDWNHLDQLRASSRQVVNSGSPETTYYVYDSSGQRVRKVTERQAAQGVTPTRMNERLYLGGFEVYRTYAADGNTLDLERQSLEVGDGSQRIALVDTRTQGADGAPAQSLRYQLSNHLGSASLELDGLAAVISYEEYHPFGSCAYQAGRSLAETNLKRYRYTGMERDEETGLNYHGARYYAPWLARWTATDPIGIGDGVNVYAYVSGNPVILHDPSGLAGGKKKNNANPPTKLPGKEYGPVTKKLARELGKGLPDGASGAGKTDMDPPSVSQDAEPDGQDADSKGATAEKKRKKTDGAGQTESGQTKGGKDPRYEPTNGPRPPAPDSGGTSHNPAPEQSSGPPHHNKRGPFGEGDLQFHEGREIDGKWGDHLVEVPDGEGPPKRIATIPKGAPPAPRSGSGIWKKLGGIAGEGISKIAPGAGTAVGVGFALKAFEEGNYFQGAVDLAGSIPVIGEFIDVGVTAYEFTTALDEEFGISDWMAGFSEEVEALDKAYRTKVGRGAPPFLKPKKKKRKRKPKRKPKPMITLPPDSEVDIYYTAPVPGPRWHLVS